MHEPGQMVTLKSNSKTMDIVGQIIDAIKNDRICTYTVRISKEAVPFLIDPTLPIMTDALHPNEVTIKVMNKHIQSSLFWAPLKP